MLGIPTSIKTRKRKSKNNISNDNIKREGEISCVLNANRLTDSAIAVSFQAKIIVTCKRYQSKAERKLGN